ncbi:MAG TPA: hypothetical protein VG498_13450 [Terriglobales bacterium]|nr:hypothetical protein [Terriglobales bacterium]
MRRTMGVVLALTLAFNSMATVAATSDAGKIKSEIAKRAVGEKAKVRITTRDKEELKGYVSEVADTTFTITRKSPAETRTLSYSDVIKVRGPGLSKASKIAIGIAVGIGVGTGIAAAIILPKCGGYCGL